MVVRLFWLVMLCGCSPPPDAVFERYAPDPGKYEALVAAAAETIHVPDGPDIDGDACPNCNGTGQVGDGRTSMPCRVCDGTGKRVTEEPVTQSKGIDQEDAPCEAGASVSEAGGHIVIECRSDGTCPPCKKWRAVELPKFKKALPDWSFEFQESDGVVPQFHITTHDGRRHDHVGYMSLEQAQDLINR